MLAHSETHPPSIPQSSILNLTSSILIQISRITHPVSSQDLSASHIQEPFIQNVKISIPAHTSIHPASSINPSASLIPISLNPVSSNPVSLNLVFQIQLPPLSSLKSVSQAQHRTFWAGQGLGLGWIELPAVHGSAFGRIQPQRPEIPPPEAADLPGGLAGQGARGAGLAF
eukprot:5134159-Pyramimonas_sp.AAC.1